MISQANYLQYLALAKQAEVAADLRQQGYTVEENKRLQDATFDLVATRGGEADAYEFKSAGYTRFTREGLIKLQQAARGAGYRFHIVVAVPPPQVDVEVEGLSAALLQYIVTSRLKQLQQIPGTPEPKRLGELSISSLRVGRGGSQVSGASSLSVEFSNGDEESPYIDWLPLRFSAVLDTEGKLQTVTSLHLDVSEYVEEAA